MKGGTETSEYMGRNEDEAEGEPCGKEEEGCGGGLARRGKRLR
jgi:hypothetical protein